MTLQKRLRSPKAGDRLAATETAADALDAHEARIKRLEEALREMVKLFDSGDADTYEIEYWTTVMNRAREALKPAQSGASE